MKFFNIDFSPLDEPLNAKLKTLVLSIWFLSYPFGSFLWFPFLYLLFTSFWWITILMASWIYLDRQTPENGGRTLKWIENSKSVSYLNDYFPANVTFAPDCNLDLKKNYLFGCFPHAIIPWGPRVNIVFKSGNFYEKYPNFNVKEAASNLLFYYPIVRDTVVMGMGLISCSLKSLNYMLGKPEGGNIVVLYPGGVRESYYSKPGKYKIYIKNRKGFIKVALKNGIDLVPVFTFGETDLLEVLEISFLKPVQDILRKYLLLLPLFNGRGFFQNSFGFIARKKSLNTVIGKPIEVKKVVDPSEEQIEEVHTKFVTQLLQLFEDYKHEFLASPADTFLELV